MYQQGFVATNIVFLLLVITTSLILEYKPTSLIKALVILSVILLTAFYAKYALLFPIIFYDYIEFDKIYSLLLFLAIGSALILTSYGNQFFLLLFYFSTLFFAIYLKKQRVARLTLEHDFQGLLNSSREQQFLLEKQNAQLIEEQNTSLSLGIAGERNRIARDIHDGVGHLLSSALIQIGAIDVINQNQQLEQPLALLKSTVAEGMTNIRESVHDLHDDSLHLEQSIQQIVRNYQGPTINVSYSVTSELSTNLKMDLVMIIREALANIMKHSNATSVYLEMTEQPAFFRLLIRDNGTGNLLKTPHEWGIGLSSMRERMIKQKGRLTAEQTNQGFQVLAIVPKHSEIGSL